MNTTQKRYHYVGPEEIRRAWEDFPAGSSIRSRADLQTWCSDNADQTDAYGVLWATFTISSDGILHLASRNSEHVACASGKDVLSAGEIGIDPESMEIVEITNQSTGYCPEPESWPAVDGACSLAGLDYPDAFTREFIFRKCEICGQRNIVKEGWFVCALCDADLPEQWNFQ